jgi:hypothetical protein
MRQVRELFNRFGRKELLRESEGNRLKVCCSRAESARMTTHLATTTGNKASGAGEALLSFHDWVEVNRCRAELMAGQHRVAALKRFLQKEFPTADGAPPEVECRSIFGVYGATS